METSLHFLNVKEGDCTWIHHADGKNTMIDVFNATSKPQEIDKLAKSITEMIVGKEARVKGVSGNFWQKNFPVNPIEYLKKFSIMGIFRYIQSHPDMDHMGGIKDIFHEFEPTNMWDTNNTKKMDSFDESPHSEEDWNYYKKLRKNSISKTNRLVLTPGSNGKYYNEDENGNIGGNGLYILAPTKNLVDMANDTGDFNDCSYVISYKVFNGSRVIIAGDSHDKTWDHILKNFKKDIKNIDILIAPHHGRDSKRNYDFLKTLNPKITFFGNAKYKDLAYKKWTELNLEKFSNNQANCLIALFEKESTKIYCTNKIFADTYCQANGYKSHFNKKIEANFLKEL